MLAGFGGVRRTRLVGGSLAVLLVLPALGVGAVGWSLADRLLHPPREHTHRDPADLGVPYEKVRFASEDGTPLAAWWIPAFGDPRGTVLFLHGYGASKAQSLAVVPFLHRAGYHVLALDFRAHGESGGSYTTIGLEEAKDVRAAFAYAVGRAHDDRVALFGWSMGAAAALHAAPDLPGARAVIADSAFARLRNVVDANLQAFTGLPEWPFGVAGLWFAARQAGHDVNDNEPARAAALLHRPLLVIQGGLDAVARPADAEALWAASDGWAELWLVPEAGHTGARHVVPAEYEARVLEFLAESMMDRPDEA